MLVLAVAIFWFEVPLRGSFLLLFAMTLVYLLTHARPRAVRLDHLVDAAAGDDDDDVLLPDADDAICRASCFRSRTCRRVIQPFTYLIPLRYFLVILRAIFLKGVGLETFWPQALALAAWGVGILLLASRSTERSA